MTIRHHLTDPLLMAYSAGELPEAFALIAATHVSMCDDCRARLGAFDALGGAVVEDMAVDMAEGSLAACMARIDTMPQANAHAPRRGNGILPAPLVDYVGGDLAAVRWRPVGLGARQAILRTSDNGASVRLLSIPAGVAMPDHSHRGVELTLVLQGAFRDQTDHFGVGDVEVADDTLDHTPVAAAGQTCICLAATEVPLRFNTLLPRLAQSFFRI
jgi:putative transcriptional regulator